MNITEARKALDGLVATDETRYDINTLSRIASLAEIIRSARIIQKAVEIDVDINIDKGCMTGYAIREVAGFVKAEIHLEYVTFMGADPEHQFSLYFGAEMMVEGKPDIEPVEALRNFLRAPVGAVTAGAMLGIQTP